MKKVKMDGLSVLLFFSLFVFASLLIGAILVCINNFVELTDTIWFLGLVVVSAVVSLAGVILIERSTKHIGETTLSFWWHQNLFKIIIGYCLLTFALVSIRNESVWSTEEVHDILSLQWTIFGLSLTIFLVWNVIIVEFLRGRQPKKPDSEDLLQKYKIVLERYTFTQEVNVTYVTIVLLTINLFLLLVSTAQIYILAKPDSVLTQNLLHCSFFFTTNSIIILFLDILKPLKKEKTELLKNNNVTKSEVDHARAALFTQTVIDGLIDELKEATFSLDDEKYTQEEKKKFYIECLEVLQDAISSNVASKSEKREIEPSNRGDDNA